MKTMKQFSLTLLLIAATICVNATVRTVSNSPAGGSQYYSVLSAYNASATGDTLLIEGTGLWYYGPDCIEWAKSLTVIGIGFNPQKQNPVRTPIAQTPCYGEFMITTGGSGSKFYGIEFTHQIKLYSGSGQSNIIFESCKFNTNFNFDGKTASNIIFKNCIFDYNNDVAINFSSNAANTNIMLTNCIIDGFLQGNSNNALSLIIDHCLFLSTTQGPLHNIHNATIRNSIFMNYATVQIGTSVNNIFNNNVNRLGSIPSGTNNQNSVNPNFVSYTLGSHYSTSHNYNLQSGSPAILAGSDGTDIGVNGGFSNFNESGEVLINPIVREMNIMNTTVQPNGTMNVQLHATKPNDQ